MISEEHCSFLNVQWQRIALARAFMRANEPGIDMFLFDEPVCLVLLDSSPFPSHQYYVELDFRTGRTCTKSNI